MLVMVSCSYPYSTYPLIISDFCSRMETSVAVKKRIGPGHQLSYENEFSGYACMHFLTKHVRWKRLWESRKLCVEWGSTNTTGTSMFMMMKNLHTY